MNILIVDDHVMVLEGLKALIETLEPNMSVNVAKDLDEAVEQLKSVQFELILLDWALEDCTGDVVIDALHKAGCIARIVVLSGFTDSLLLKRVLEAGAAGFIPKKFDADHMLAALKDVLAGKLFIPAMLHVRSVRESRKPNDRNLTLQDRLSNLTPRQFEVYRHAARGLPNKLIARTLGISEETVKTHLSIVYTALGVKNRTEAAIQASREGIRLD